MPYHWRNHDYFRRDGSTQDYQANCSFYMSPSVEPPSHVSLTHLTRDHFAREACIQGLGARLAHLGELSPTSPYCICSFVTSRVRPCAPRETKGTSVCHSSYSAGLPAMRSPIGTTAHNLILAISSPSMV
jgi:hypothetical protein